MCGELFAEEEKTKTITRARLIASVMAEAHSWPGEIFLGAIQQPIACNSNAEQIASAQSLSVECPFRSSIPIRCVNRGIGDVPFFFSFFTGRHEYVHYPFLKAFGGPSLSLACFA
jgi:hypothetical protein